MNKIHQSKMIKNIATLKNHGRKELRGEILSIADSLLHEINARKIVKENVHLENNILKIKDEEYPLDSQRIFVVGFGKAAVPMAQALWDILGNKITAGIINSPFPSRIPLFKINVVPHPFPDKRTVAASQEIIDFVRKLNEEDILLCLISGGASALFEIPIPGISIEEESKIIKLMMRRGADIIELNKVRVALSQVKGGKFLRFVRAKNCISLIISDVIGPPQFVGSGPTYPQKYEIDKLLEKYELHFQIPEYEISESKAENIVLADNTYALEKAFQIAKDKGYEAKIFPEFLRGDPQTLLNKFSRVMEKNTEKILIFGGETTVNVGNALGKGGRNQELALYLAKLLPPYSCFLCMGTDGIDGPTDAAGGIVDDLTLKRAEQMNIDVEKELENHNSYHVLHALKDLIFTGYTGTNLADICIGIRAKAP